MKKIIIALYLFCMAGSVNAQNLWTDSIKNLLASAKEDSTKLRLLSPLVTYYTYSIPDSALTYAEKEISLSKKIKSDYASSFALRSYGGILSEMGNYSQAIYFELEALKAAERSGDPLSIGWCYAFLSSTYIDAGDYEHALFYSHKEKSLAESHHKLSRDNSKNDIYDLYNDAMFSSAIIYDKLNKPDSALKNLQIVNQGNVQQYG